MRRILFTNANFLRFDHGQSTFRLGSKWADLRIGEEVELALVDGGVETVVGTAAVDGVVTGTYDVLLTRHRHTNHETDHDLDTRMRNIYGHLVTNDAPAVVIYLRRLTTVEPPPVEAPAPDAA